MRPQPLRGRPWRHALAGPVRLLQVRMPQAARDLHEVFVRTARALATADVHDRPPTPGG
ncbi:hypothetical protein ACFWM5_21140 [Streptomyces bobili]|uniref:hypothetical protein n=1 Tax=Streptomyces bobili TaxID=67280 RepID=UPI003651FF8A